MPKVREDEGYLSKNIQSGKRRNKIEKRNKNISDVAYNTINIHSSSYINSKQ